MTETETALTAVSTCLNVQGYSYVKMVPISANLQLANYCAVLFPLQINLLFLINILRIVVSTVQQRSSNSAPPPALGATSSASSGPADTAQAQCKCIILMLCMHRCNDL